MRASAVLAMITFLLSISPEGAMSDQGEPKREPLTVYGEPVEAKHWTEDPSPEDVRDLTPEELSRIKRFARRITDWSDRYPHENVTAGQLSPAILDFYWQEWLDDEAPDRPASEEAVDVLGSAFGHYLIAKLGMRWVQITDKYGTDTCVRGSPGDVTVCPYSVVSKRVEARGVDFFGGVFEVTKQRLAESRE